MANVKLTPEVEGVLRRSTISGNALTLPGQLDRSLYESVNKVLANAGGKWSREAKAHVFTSDPRHRLGLVLETGVSVDEKKLYQAFYTPQPLAERLVRLANVKGQVVLEPSAGGGALARECVRAGCKELLCIELHPEAVEGLEAQHFCTIHADFMQVEPTPLLFDRVVMNPPFSKNQDVKHVAHALTFLKPGGILVAIMSPNTQRTAFDALLNHGRSEVYPVPEGTFAESGTPIRTIILKLTKGGAL